MTLFGGLAISLVLVAAVYVGICYLFAQLTLNPKRQPVVASPAGYGLEFEDVEFDSIDGLCLKGWFIPGDPKKVLLLTHPMYCNRHGFLVQHRSPFMAANTDIDLLLSMQALNRAGYSLLTFDFRNHGESEDGLTGVGLNEYQDVLGALHYLERRPDLAQADSHKPGPGTVRQSPVPDRHPAHLHVCIRPVLRPEHLQPAGLDHAATDGALPALAGRAPT
jgi:hypothetical protein